MTTPTTRAENVINAHLANIEAAQRFLEANKDRLIPGVHDALAVELGGAHRLCNGYINHVIGIPEYVCGMLGDNGFGPRINDACAAVDKALARSSEALAYRDMVAARRLVA